MLNKSEYFEPIDPDEKNDEFIAIESKSFFKDVCERFVKNKRAMIALVIFLIIALMAIFGPMISPYSYDGMDTAIMNQRSTLVWNRQIRKRPFYKSSLWCKNQSYGWYCYSSD